jgi:hypothetical protein
MDSLAHGDRLWIPEGLPRGEILERGQARATSLGIPSDVHWVWAWTPDPIVPEGFVLRYVQSDPQPPEPGEGDAPICGPALRRFAGHRFQLFGPLVTRADTAADAPRSSPYQLRLPVVLQPGAPWRLLVVDLWDAVAWHEQSPIYALMRWATGTEPDWSVHGFDPRPSPQRAKDEWAAARRALTRLRNQLRLGGQQRIEDKPEARNRLRLAKHARALRQKGWDWKRIVLELAPDDIDYEGYEEKYGNPGEGNRRAERAAIDRMRYLVERFEEIERKS